MYLEPELCSAVKLFKTQFDYEQKTSDKPIKTGSLGFISAEAQQLVQLLK